MQTTFQPLLDESKMLLFVGIGNRLKSDDTIGIYICEHLNQGGRKHVLIVESGIEKYVGKINTIAPDILVLADCTDFNEPPGYYDLFSIDKTRDHTMHTHTISLLKISEFFTMQTYILGIQPGFVGFGETITPAVLNSANLIIARINEIS
ncbi:MAG: hydrogenase maturation protease [Candidatus Cloacimonadaceae bacterium]|nr:hydrogenase maturation protease [Candidatus Cloacimonadaceae bacterium]